MSGRAGPGRYHLYAAFPCPFSHRVRIVRALKGLENVVSVSYLDPMRDGRGWAFREGKGHDLDKVNGFAMWGFSAALLFKQAVDSVVKDHGVNGLTRANLVAAIKATHSFNGGGMYGTVDPGNKRTSSCFVIVKVQGGKFVREYPTKPGTMDCKPSKHVWIEEDLNSQ